MVEQSVQQNALRRSLSQTQMVLYGLGTTVGAGIYALIGEIAGIAGHWAPWSFLLAAALAAFTALSFAELSARYPKAAGAALYVQNGFDSERLALVVGILVIVAGTVSSAALLNGFVGYLQEFIALPRTAVILMAALLLGLIALWGIAESVWIAGLISVIEVAGLIWITSLSATAIEFGQVNVNLLIPDFSLHSFSLIAGGAVLAFYAYIGFEDMVEVAEEVRDVTRTLPRAILLTLGLSSLIYVVLVTSTILATGPELLAGSSAPLADVYRSLTGNDPITISLIGLFAIINGALIQIIMASRVLYGLASRGQIPQWFARVNGRTRTPVLATITAASTTLLLALSGSLALLAEMTAVTMLCIFALVNLALYRLTRKQARIRAFLAMTGAVVCTAFALRSAVLWII